jgi:hypothetical protein
VAGHIYNKFHEDWYRRSSNIKGLSQKFERRQCREGVDMGSRALIYIPSFIKNGSGIQNLTGLIHIRALKTARKSIILYKPYKQTQSENN